jgi:malate dehydrogenase (oxaloacetate-decarboxylating)
VSLDCTYRLRIPHRPGKLALVTGAIAEHGGLIGDVVTITLGREASIRDITIEARDDAHADELAEALDQLDGIDVVWHRDRALLRHEGGKLEVRPCAPVRTVQDARDFYTPGVARVAQAIADDPSLARRYTWVSRSVAICTNGTRVLGLGDIGARAAGPVMEGKALFYAEFAGLSAVPILIDTPDTDEFVETVVRIAPGFGGIHLEDIAAPECFEIEARLLAALPQPVMHDDVHGTAVVAVAAAMVGCRHIERTLEEVVVGQVGLGAAGYGIAALMVRAGAGKVLGSDPDEASQQRARDAGVEIRSLELLMNDADLVVATTGKPGLIRPASVRKGQVILALSNPEPEIASEKALEAGAAFASDGSIVNNMLGYPGIFRGALEAGAEEISVPMKLAAARTIADMTQEAELVPDPLDPSVHERVAKAVRESAGSTPKPA